MADAGVAEVNGKYELVTVQVVDTPGTADAFGRAVGIYPTFTKLQNPGQTFEYEVLIIKIGLPAKAATHRTPFSEPRPDTPNTGAAH